MRLQSVLQEKQLALPPGCCRVNILGAPAHAAGDFAGRTHDTVKALRADATHTPGAADGHEYQHCCPVLLLEAGVAHKESVSSPAERHGCWKEVLSHTPPQAC